jgi:hypothetical protein
MKRIYAGVVLGCLILTTNLLAAEVDNTDTFSKLNKKIIRQLKRDRWDYASRTFVRLLWDDYKRAHENTQPELSATSIHGKLPDIQEYAQYVGLFKRDQKKTTKAFCKIKKSEKGRFFVELTRNSYPAVAINKSIIFTTGKIMQSSLPRLTAKPYCTLRIFTIARIDGKYFFFSLESPPSKWLELFKYVEE